MIASCLEVEYEIYPPKIAIAFLGAACMRIANKTWICFKTRIDLTDVSISRNRSGNITSLRTADVYCIIPLSGSDIWGIFAIYIICLVCLVIVFKLPYPDRFAFRSRYKFAPWKLTTKPSLLSRCSFWRQTTDIPARPASSTVFHR